MKTALYLTIACDGKGAKVTKNRPTVEPYEACVYLNIEIPDQYFERPQLLADITVPPMDGDNPVIAVCEGDIASAVKEATGLNMNITVVHEEQQ